MVFLFEKIVAQSAGYLVKELKLTQEQESILTYALKVLFSSIIGYSAIFIISWVIGVLPYTLAAVITASVLRTFAGGAHAGSAFNCTVIGGTVFTALGLLGKYTSDWVHYYYIVFAFAAGLAAIIIIARYAPADTPSKPITNTGQRRRLRGISIAFIICWLVSVLFNQLALFKVPNYIIYSSTLGLAWQAFSLTPAGYCLGRILDNTLNKVKVSFRVISKP